VGGLTACTYPVPHHAMRQLTDKELKREFESPRGQMKTALIALGFFVVGSSLFFLLLRDPFGWFTDAPAARDAKKWIVLSIFIVWLPVLAGIWFMVIRPLQTGIVAGGSKYRAPYLVLRSEQPARFRDHIWWNCVMLAVGLVIGTRMLVGLIRELRQASAVGPNAGELMSLREHANPDHRSTARARMFR
jgi:hypothetical protein